MGCLRSISEVLKRTIPSIFCTLKTKPCITDLTTFNRNFEGDSIMDISKAKKPIHIRCPYCKKDLQYNGASIKSQKEGLLLRISTLNSKYQAERDHRRRSALLREINETKFRLKLLSEDVHMLNQMSELETLKIFKRKVRDILGKEECIRLFEESEKQYLEDNTFNYYDLAKQNFNTFNGA